MMKKAFTLIEVVVAMGVFAVLMVATSLLLISTLRGAKKSGAQISVRTEGARIMDVISSSLRYAQISSCSGSSITAQLLDGSSVTYSCQTNGSDNYFASGSSRLMSTNVVVVDCTNVFSCPDAKTVQVTYGLQRAGTNLTVEATGRIDFDSQIRLRN